MIDDDDRPELSTDAARYMELFFQLVQHDGMGGAQLSYMEVSHAIDRNRLPEREARFIFTRMFSEYRRLREEYRPKE